MCCVLSTESAIPITTTTTTTVVVIVNTSTSDAPLPLPLDGYPGWYFVQLPFTKCRAKKERGL